MKKFIKKKCKLLVALTIFWIIFLSVFNPFMEKKEGERKYGYEQNNVITLNKGDILEQSFIMPFEGFHSIKLNFWNIVNQKDGVLLIQLYNETGNKEILKKEVYLSEVSDTGTLIQGFTAIPNSNGQKFELKLTNVSDETLELIGHDEKAEFEKNTFINERKSKKTLNFSTIFSNLEINLIYIVLWLLVVVASYVCILFVKGNYKYDFLVIASTMGLAFLLLNPFPQPLDESTHFFRSFCISQGDWHDSINNEGKIGAQMPENYGDVLATEFSPLSWYSNRELFNENFSNQKEYYVNPYMSSVIPLDHAISAIGISIGNFLRLPVAIVIYLSRIIDLLFYLLFGYIALSRLRYYQSVFFGVLLLPTCLFLAGSCTQDAVLISAALCFIATCLKYIMDKNATKVGKKDIFLLLFTVLFIASIKYLIYTPIFLLIILIPKKKFNKNTKFIIGLIIIVMSVAAIGYQICLLEKFPFTEDRNGYVVVSEQIKFVFDNLYYTYRNFGTYFFENILRHIQDTSVSGLIGISSFTGVWVVFGSVIAQDKYQWSDKKLKAQFLWMIFLMSAIIFVLTMAALYAGFTPVGKWGIDGLQTRYIYPFLPLVGILLAQLPVENYMKNYEVKYAFIMLIANVTAIANRCL